MAPRESAPTNDGFRPAITSTQPKGLLIYSIERDDRPSSETLAREIQPLVHEVCLNRAGGVYQITKGANSGTLEQLFHSDRELDPAV